MHSRGSRRDRPAGPQDQRGLIEIFAKIDVKLVDFKIEMGRATDGTLLLADEITPDSCRLWDQKDHSGKVEHLDKDLFRRGLGSIIPAYEEIEERLAELAKSEGIEVAEYALSGSPLEGSQLSLISRKDFHGFSRVRGKEARL